MRSVWCTKIWTREWWVRMCIFAIRNRWIGHRCFDFNRQSWPASRSTIITHIRYLNLCHCFVSIAFGIASISCSSCNFSIHFWKGTPMGATIECWPKKCQQPRPVFSTFVLTSENAVKVYGAAVTFYEKYPQSKLTNEERIELCFTCPEDEESKSLHASKSICILSRYSFFDTFEKFLLFLYKTQSASVSVPLTIPIEKYISQ